MPTGISYADEVWNVCIGCTKIKSGCLNCWAKRLHNQRHLAWKEGRYPDAPKQYHKSFGHVQLLPDRLDQPLHWRRPRTIFVNSMGDTFHKDVPIKFILQIFDVIRQCPRHTFMLFTKRWEMACQFFGADEGADLMSDIPKNVHLYFSASTQTEVDEAVPILLEIPVAVRGLSLEPLLEAVRIPRTVCSQCGLGSIERQTGGCKFGSGGNCRCGAYLSYKDVKFNSIILGCESGPNRRPCKIEWIESIVNQCQEASVDCYVKQMEIDGKVCGDPKKFPENLRVRRMPK